MFNKQDLDSIRAHLTNGQLQRAKFWRLRHLSSGGWLILIPWVQDKLKPMAKLPDEPTEADVLRLVRELLQTQAFEVSPRNLADLVDTLGSLVYRIQQMRGK